MEQIVSDMDVTIDELRSILDDESLYPKLNEIHVENEKMENID